MKTCYESFEKFTLARTRPWRRIALKWSCVLTVVSGLAFCATAAPGAASGVGGKKDFKCFTGNAYIGAEIEAALTVDPNDPIKLIQTTTEIYMKILASQPPVRLAALAQEIASQAPDVASLVEMWTIETAEATTQGPGEFTIVYDYLNLLTNALGASGAHYDVAVVSKEMEITLPILVDLATQTPGFGRVTDHEVILYRSDLPPGYLRLSNPQTGQFSHFIQIPAVGISVNRGWCSADVFTRGERFRFICTHLEDENAPELQLLQGAELLAGPAATAMPVLLTGDFNADPLHRNGTQTYDLFPAAGFKDAWNVTHPTDPAGGLTWGHDPLLADPTVAFSWRLDLVLYKGPQFHPTQIEILDPLLELSGPPLWPSDHGTVSASFALGNAKAVAKKPAALVTQWKR